MSNIILKASEKKNTEKLKDISKNNRNLMSKFSEKKQKANQSVHSGSIKEISRKVSNSTISSVGGNF